MEKAEIIYNRLYTRYFSPGDKVFNSNNTIDYLDSIGTTKAEIVNYIDDYLKRGYKVRAGYTTTGIRGYHDRILIITDNIVF